MPWKQFLLESDLDAHEEAADPHTGYLKESDSGVKDAASGYAGLDASTALTVAQIRGLREFGGQALDMGAIADGEYLKRVGTDIVGAAAGNGGATTALDNLASVAINTSLLPATDSAIDLGSATPKYWRAGYIDKLYLNATATLDGATAGKVNLTGNLQVSGAIAAMGTTPNPAMWIAASPSAPSFVTATGLEINPSSSTFSAPGSFYGVRGQPAVIAAALSANNTVDGLLFFAGATAQFTTASFVRLRGCTAGVAVLGYGTTAVPCVLTVDEATCYRAPKPSIGELGTDCTVSVTEYNIFSGLDPANALVVDLYGLRIDDCSAATGVNRLLMLGPGTGYLVLEGSGDWTAADNETPLFIGADDPTTLQQVTLGAADSGGAGFRCLRIPNL